MDEQTTDEQTAAQVVEARRVSFGAVADVYDQARPKWPIETLTWLMGDPQGAVDVLEVGAGTGLGTRPLIAAGHRVIAAEPSDGMLRVLRESLTREGLDDRGAQTIEAKAEELPLSDDCVDAVISLQAWHWVDPARGGHECQRVLREGGMLGLAWHNLDLDVDWVAELNDITGGSRIETDEKDVHLDPRAEGFEPFEHQTFDHVHPLDADGLVLLADSWSFVQVADDRDGILERVRDLGRRVADEQGRVLVPYRTSAHRARRL